MNVGACGILVHLSVDVTFSHKYRFKTLAQDLRCRTKRTLILASKVSKIRKGIMEANVFRHGWERCMKTLEYQLHLILVEIYVLLPLLLEGYKALISASMLMSFFNLSDQNHHAQLKS